MSAKRLTMRRHQGGRGGRSGAPAGTIRIIGGRWRGRKLPVPAIDGLRPTADRLRETLFNWLMWDLPEARCLDLFAGTGALGLEALSRGAAHCTLVESMPVAAEALAGNIGRLGAEGAELVRGDALAWLGRGTSTYDLVFVDPPFAAELWPAVLAALPPRLAPDARVYVEWPRALEPEWPPAWDVVKESRVGDVCGQLLRYGAANDAATGG